LGKVNSQRIGEVQGMKGKRDNHQWGDFIFIVLEFANNGTEQKTVRNEWDGGGKSLLRGHGTLK
jgi:hypothetical protein